MEIAFPQTQLISSFGIHILTMETLHPIYLGLTSWENCWLCKSTHQETGDLQLWGDFFWFSFAGLPWHQWLLSQPLLMADPTPCRAKRNLVHGGQKVASLNTILCSLPWPAASPWLMQILTFARDLPLCCQSLLKRFFWVCLDFFLALLF